MDSELEDLVYQNNTDELYDFDFEPTVWDYLEDSLEISFSCVGLLADFVLIYMIARNVRMRTKTNIILLNIAINDALFILSNLHFLSALLELMNFRTHASRFTNCLIQFVDVGFQFNEALAFLMLISNTLMKSKRIEVKWLVIGIYTFTVCNIIMHVIHCHYKIFPIFFMLCVLIFVGIFGVVVIKEVNNCYKKYHKKDPLSPRTLFRLNIGRIYTGSWFATFLMYNFYGLCGVRYFWFTMAQHSFMTNMYILIYLVYTDKNFKICLLQMLKCKFAGEYDVDATITFAEEDSSDDSSDNNHVNINFNGTENRIETQDMGRIRLP